MNCYSINGFLNNLFSIIKHSGLYKIITSVVKILFHDSCKLELLNMKQYSNKFHFMPKTWLIVSFPSWQTHRWKYWIKVQMVKQFQISEEISKDWKNKMEKNCIHVVEINLIYMVSFKKRRENIMKETSLKEENITELLHSVTYM